MNTDKLRVDFAFAFGYLPSAICLTAIYTSFRFRFAPIVSICVHPWSKFLVQREEAWDAPHG